MDKLNYIFTLTSREQPEKVNHCIARNRNLCAFYEIEFKVIPFEYDPSRYADIAIHSQTIALELAAKDPRILHLDWDTLLVNIPKVNTDFPMFHISTDMAHPLLDTIIFYNGDSTDLFSSYLEYYRMNGLGQGHNVPLTSFFKTRTQRVPPRDYIHYGTGLWLKGRGTDLCTP